jgi:WhiB family redox-sensing transcriptional regulator
VREVNWIAQANCAGTDSEAFFPEIGESPALAKKVCSKCEVKTQCLHYAIDNNISFGIWGGTNEKDRRHLKKQRRAA